MKRHHLPLLFGFPLAIVTLLLASGSCTIEHREAPGDPSPPPPSLSKVEAGYVTSFDGARLYYQRVGDGPRVVIIPMGWRLFADFRALERTDRTLLFYDMRNRGRSDMILDPGKISIENDVRDLEAVRSHFGFERVSLIGSSYLGVVVAIYASEHPSVVDRIVQIGPPGLPYTPQETSPAELAGVPPNALARLEELRSSGYAEENPREYCEEEWQITRVSLVGAPRIAHRLGASDCDLHTERPPSLWPHLAALTRSLEQIDFALDDAGSLAVPLLVVHGTRDRHAPYAEGKHWAAAVPGARLLTVEGAAHLPWVDQPGRVFGSISAFLDGAP
ncbi:MAG TPA: alpha/beta hydrolase [Thermoanaerobaculia bacterium]|nr:alpha/beta hydrolase [Thermoanaerobaculia bacterium]